MGRFRIAVVGGSLGGLTAASLLRDDGHDVTVYERSPRPLEQQGAGIGLLESAYRYPVERIGVDLDRIGIETSFIRYLQRDGSLADETAHRYLFSSWNTIYQATLQAFDPDRYLLGHDLERFDCLDGGVRLAFTNGSRVEADLLVAADGIGSATRARLQPDAEPIYAGYVAWRGTVPETELDPNLVDQLGDAITYHVFANSHILVYPIPNLAGEVEPGQRLINFVWYRNYLEGGDLTDLLTDRHGRTRERSVPPGQVAEHHVAELRATAAARLPPALAAVVEACGHPFIQTIYDIEVDRMGFGRVCLIGDAAFAVRPHAAAGTAKAADDGWALAHALRDADDVPEALGRWEPNQLAVGRELLERTRRIGSRSQVSNDWQPGDPELIFGLHEPGR